MGYSFVVIPPKEFKFDNFQFPLWDTDTTFASGRWGFDFFQFPLWDTLKVKKG